VKLYLTRCLHVITKLTRVVRRHEVSSSNVECSLTEGMDCYRLERRYKFVLFFFISRFLPDFSVVKKENHSGQRGT
jgi:hypothetical protein